MKKLFLIVGLVILFKTPLANAEKGFSPFVILLVNFHSQNRRKKSKIIISDKS